MPLTAEDLSDVHRVLFDTAPDAIMILDENGTPALVNAAARDLPCREDLLKAWRTDGEWFAFRAELRTRGRATLEVRIGERVIAISGRTCGPRSILFISDVTAAREAEADVARLWGLASIGAFAGSFVHDFGNLLTPLSALGDALARELSGNATGAAVVTELQRTTHSAAELVRGVRAFLRGRSTPPQQLDLNAIVLEMKPLIERLVGEGVGVVLSLNDEVGSIVVDRVRFERGLLNLVANARDAMPSGGRLIIRTYSALLDGEPFVALSVTDEGEGMSQADRARAFEPLFTTKGDAGTGLGLWIVRRFIRESGGRLEVHSEQGEGTQVTLYLPQALPGSSYSREAPGSRASQTDASSAPANHLPAKSPLAAAKPPVSVPSTSHFPFLLRSTKNATRSLDHAWPGMVNINFAALDSTAPPTICAATGRSSAINPADTCAPSTLSRFLSVIVATRLDMAATAASFCTALGTAFSPYPTSSSPKVA
jgi:signal transduction histidine kinase